MVNTILYSVIISYVNDCILYNICLQKSRGERMMLITTHFMEEADALGDQIAIMNHGEIFCYGTPLFLKKQYGQYFLFIIFFPSLYDSPKAVVQSSPCQKRMLPLLSLFKFFIANSECNIL